MSVSRPSSPEPIARPVEQSTEPNVQKKQPASQSNGLERVGPLAELPLKKATTSPVSGAPSLKLRLPDDILHIVASHSDAIDVHKLAVMDKQSNQALQPEINSLRLAARISNEASLSLTDVKAYLSECLSLGPKFAAPCIRTIGEKLGSVKDTERDAAFDAFEGAIDSLQRMYQDEPRTALSSAAQAKYSTSVNNAKAERAVMTGEMTPDEAAKKFAITDPKVLTRLENLGANPLGHSLELRAEQSRSRNQVNVTVQLFNALQPAHSGRLTEEAVDSLAQHVTNKRIGQPMPAGTPEAERVRSFESFLEVLQQFQQTQDVSRLPALNAALLGCFPEH
jgi:hypothetical protein